LLAVQVEPDTEPGHRLVDPWAELLEKLAPDTKTVTG